MGKNYSYYINVGIGYSNLGNRRYLVEKYQITTHFWTEDLILRNFINLIINSFDPSRSSVWVNMTWVWSKMINPLKCKLEIVLLIIHKLPTYNKAADYETPSSNETLKSAVVAVIHKTFFDIQKLYSIKVLPYVVTKKYTTIVLG